MKRTPLRRRSTRKARTDAAYKHACRLVVERSNGLCELRTPVCDGAASQVHHLLPRSQGGNDHDPNLLAATCTPCHDHTHANPADAYEHGWLLRSTR